MSLKRTRQQTKLEAERSAKRVAAAAPFLMKWRVPAPLETCEAKPSLADAVVDYMHLMAERHASLDRFVHAIHPTMEVGGEIYPLMIQQQVVMMSMDATPANAELSTRSDYQCARRWMSGKGEGFLDQVVDFGEATFKLSTLDDMARALALYFAAVACLLLPGRSHHHPLLCQFSPSQKEELTYKDSVAEEEIAISRETAHNLLNGSGLFLQLSLQTRGACFEYDGKQYDAMSHFVFDEGARSLPLVKEQFFAELARYGTKRDNAKMLAFVHGFQDSLLWDVLPLIGASLKDLECEAFRDLLADRDF